MMNRRDLLSSLALVGTNSSVVFARAVGGGDAARHGFVFQRKGRFGGWPANGGVWSWGSEIVVAFTMGYHQEKRDEHSVDRTKQNIVALGRSKDGGETWTVEEHDELNNSPGAPCPGGIEFGHPDFALRCGKSWFHVSDNRGKTWQGPYQLPDFGMGLELTARTDFLVEGKRECLLFLSAKDEKVQAGIQDRAFCTRTSDGGKTFQFVSWMTDEPRSVRSVMPSTVRVSGTQLVSALRRRVDPALEPRCDINWIDAYGSNDNGKTWGFLSRVAYTDLVLHNGNPPSLVRLKDSRLCVTYGFRGVPFGIRAKISRDNGRSWEKEIILREDGRTWDLGYTRSIVRPDGKITTIYYFTTEKHPEQHIACTIWDPDRIPA
jgi:BNR repeat-like domain